ncbi:hypothetical protein [Kitasatospora indigofera]|uniref:hypothetical protein n=1 Tax=Kitasatospora indigofera TaxID=67307 RepID=UPI003698DB6E
MLTRRFTRLALSAALVTAAGAGLLSTGSAHAVGISTVGGQITRSEVLARAQSWVDEGVWYSQQGTYSDSNGSYRPDCSGYVSMSWHLGQSRTTWTLPGVSAQLGSFDDLKPGDALDRYNPATAQYDTHVILFAGWVDGAHTSANIYTESQPGTQASRKTYSRSYLNSQNYVGFRYNNIVDASPTSYPDPASLPTGTLVKASNDPTVKLMISGAGLAVSGSDVTPDGYDMSKVVTVDDAKFWALPSSLPAGTVVHDQGGGANRYVIVGGAALPITGAEWTADGYSIRPDMGVPGAWLASAQQTVLPTGTLVTGQSGGDPSIYVMVNNSALPITGNEWTADGYAGQALMGVPETWLGAAVAKPLADRTVVKDVSGANATVHVMAGGKAVALSGADYTALHYDAAPLVAAPGTWLAAAAARPAPADGTLLVSPDSATVWLVTGHGGKKALTAADFGPGKYDLAKVVTVPTALTASLPTVTS